MRRFAAPGCSSEQACRRLRGNPDRARRRQRRGLRSCQAERGAGLYRACQYQLLALPQRHHAVADRLGLSDPEGHLRARLRADRHDHAGVPVHGLAAAAGGRPLHRQEGAALLIVDRHGLDLLRPFATQCRAPIPRHPRRRRAGRSRLGGVSPGIGSLRAAATALRNRCFSSAAASAPRWGRCSRR